MVFKVVDHVLSMTMGWRVTGEPIEKGLRGELGEFFLGEGAT